MEAGRPSCALLHNNSGTTNGREGTAGKGAFKHISIFGNNI